MPPIPAKLVALSTYANVLQAELVKERLEDEGIPAAVADETLAQTYPGLEPAMGGIRLLVHEADLLRAREVIAQLPKPMGSAPASTGISTEEIARLAEASPLETAAPHAARAPRGSTEDSKRRQWKALVVTAAVVVLLVALAFATKLV